MSSFVDERQDLHRNVPRKISKRASPCVALWA